MEQTLLWLKKSLAVYTTRRALVLFALGFSAGLPIALVFGTLSFRLREAGISRTEIGFFSWAALAYSFKWMWAPFVDRLQLPCLYDWLGRRRSWIFFTQICIAILLILMARLDPITHLYGLALCTTILAFASATQDIAIDAYRIESASHQEQGALAATYLTGYRLAMLVSGAGALAIAAMMGSNNEYNPHGWFWAYFTMALCMGASMLTTLLCQEPEQQSMIKHAQVAQGLSLPTRLSLWFQLAFIQPFRDFFQRYGWYALMILALISCYRLSDVVLGVMANSFYVDIGFTKMQVAAVSKFYGVLMTLIGAALGGILVARQSIWTVLMYGAISTALTNLLFISLSHVGANTLLLTLVISADNLTAGLATAAFIAYLSSLTNVAYSATQYALFSSVMLLFPKFVAGFSGIIVDHLGYQSFFTITMVLGFPVVGLIILMRKMEHRYQPETFPCTTSCVKSNR